MNIFTVSRKIIFILLFGLGIGGCVVFKTTDVERNFKLLDLLIDISYMPSGWKIEQPAQLYDPGSLYHSIESGKVVFVANVEPRKAAGIYVFRYKNNLLAEDDFQFNTTSVTGSGEFIPDNWIPPTVATDEDKFRCFLRRVDGEDKEFMLCEWFGRYKEVVVKFNTWILPELMSLEDMAIVVSQIDQRITPLLNDLPK